MMANQRYAFDNALSVQAERLCTLEAIFDEQTIGQLEARGVQPGWRCLEIGAGGGSIASWLCNRVEPGGTVVATDLDTTHLGDLDHHNLDVQVHDVIHDKLPEAEFDLVHLRLVAAWLPKPRAAVERIVDALKPGGWLLAEELDFVSAVPGPCLDPQAEALLGRIVAAHNACLSSDSTFDLFYGRRLADDLSDAGLVDVGCAGHVSMWRGGQPGGRLWQLTLAQLRDGMIRTGEVTAAEIDHAMELFGRDSVSLLSPVTMAAWGRRAEGL
jgi:SAM-dependent methyltransferase